MADQKISQFGTITAAQAKAASTEVFFPCVDPSQIDPDTRNKRMLLSEVISLNDEGFTELTDGATITWNYLTGSKKVVTLGGNRVLDLTNAVDGDCGILHVIQDGTGSKTLDLPGNSPAGLALSPGAGEVDVLGFVKIGSAIFWSIENYGVPENITPDAPTNPITDDIADTFDWTNTPGYTDLSDYEYTVNGGSSYSDVVAKPISIGDVAKAIGQVGVRVKAATGQNASATLYNDVAFTTSGGATDPDAQAFIDYVETTLAEPIDAGDETLVHNWFLAYKAQAGLYDKVLAAHLVIGGAVGRTINAVNPDNTNAAKRIVATGATIDDTGVTTDGVDDFFEANIVDGVDLPDDAHTGYAIAFYNGINRAAADSKLAFGSNMAGFGASYMNLKNAAGNFEGRLQQAGDVNYGANTGTTQGNFLFNVRDNGSNIGVRRVLLGTTVIADVVHDSSVARTGSTQKIYFGAAFNEASGLPILPDNCRFGILVIFDEGLTDVQETAAINANTAFITGKGR
jgi:hypothetical protein